MNLKGPMKVTCHTVQEDNDEQAGPSQMPKPSSCYICYTVGHKSNECPKKVGWLDYSSEEDSPASEGAADITFDHDEQGDPIHDGDGDLYEVEDDK